MLKDLPVLALLGLGKPLFYIKSAEIWDCSKDISPGFKAVQQFQNLLIASVVSFEVMLGQGIHETCRSFIFRGSISKFTCSSCSFIEGCDYL